MNINLSITGMYAKTAVTVHNREQRVALEDAMRREYPDLMELWGPGELAGDGIYGDNFETCIALHIYDNEESCVQIADEDYWIRNGYVVIDFSLLLEEPTDYGSFSSADSDLSCLFI